MKRSAWSVVFGSLLGSVLLPGLLPGSSALALPPVRPATLAGAWRLAAADVVHPDGSRTADFGPAPKGLLLIDGHGHYSLQIFSAQRPRFRAGDKARGSDEEYKAAVMGSSTHYGTLSVDAAHAELVFRIEAASFPNWEGQEQRRRYELHGDTLSYRVPPRPNGDVPVSVWRRIGPPMAGP